MLKAIFKLLAWLALIAGIIVGITAWDKSNKSEYIEIYGDDEDLY